MESGLEEGQFEMVIVKTGILGRWERDMGRHRAVERNLSEVGWAELGVDADAVLGEVMIRTQYV